MRNKAFFLFLIFPLLVSSCRPSPRRVERAFYYWKSVFTLRPEDRDYLRRMKIDKLYVKFFDVVWETAHNQPVPVSVVRFASKMPAGIAVVPTVFITEEVLRRSPADGLPRLAADIGRKAREIQDVAGIGACREIQIDCDWTEGSKAAYFALLAAIRAGLPPGTALSATIRLHQVRYSARTGVPPVDRGMLMFYNLEAPSDFGVRNSILAFETGRVELSRGADGLCPDMDRYRFVQLEGDRINVYYGRPPKLMFKEYMTIDVKNLRTADKALLTEGLTVEGDQGVAELLEGLGE